MRKWIYAGVVLAGACVLAGDRAEPGVELHPSDWSVYLEGDVNRSFKSLNHFIFHLKELMSIQLYAAQLYLTRAIDASFRERIMIVTALANRCAM
ncbi:MAG: hypothetical protein ACOC78_01375 [Actinomycetota bacterium]